MRRFVAPLVIAITASLGLSACLTSGERIQETALPSTDSDDRSIEILRETFAAVQSDPSEKEARLAACLEKYSMEVRRLDSCYLEGAYSLSPSTTTTTVSSEVEEGLTPEQELVILKLRYRFDERSERIVELQGLLGVTADGHYGNQTYNAHKRVLSERGLSDRYLPELPQTETTLPAPAPETTVPKIPETTLPPIATHVDLGCYREAEPNISSGIGGMDFNLNPVYWYYCDVDINGDGVADYVRYDGQLYMACPERIDIQPYGATYFDYWGECYWDADWQTDPWGYLNL